MIEPDVLVVCRGPVGFTAATAFAVYSIGVAAITKHAWLAPLDRRRH